MPLLASSYSGDRCWRCVRLCRLFGCPGIDVGGVSLSRLSWYQDWWCVVNESGWWENRPKFFVPQKPGLAFYFESYWSWMAHHDSWGTNLLESVDVLYANIHCLFYRCAQCFQPFPDGVFYEVSQAIQPNQLHMMYIGSRYKDEILVSMPFLYLGTFTVISTSVELNQSLLLRWKIFTFGT